MWAGREERQGRQERQKGGRGPPEKQTLSSEKHTLGPASPAGGWRPRAEVCSYPTMAVPGWWPLGAVGSSCHPGSCPLAPAHSPRVTGPSCPRMMLIFATCPQDGCQPPPASRPLLLVTSEAPPDLQRKKRRKNTTGQIELSPAAPQAPSLPSAWLPQSVAAGGG